MKKLFLLVFATVLAFSLAACGEEIVCQHRDANDDGFCDKCSEAYADGKDVIDSPTTDDPTKEDPTEEDPTKEDPTEEDPTRDDPTEDDPTKEDPTDEPTGDEPTDAPTEDAPTKDDPTKDDPTKDDPNADKPDDDELCNYGVHYYLPEGFEYMKTTVSEFYYTDGKASIYFNHFDKERLEEMEVDPGISVYNYTRQFAAWNSISFDSLSYDAKRNIGTIETVSDFGAGAETGVPAEYFRFQIMRGGDYLYLMTAACPEDDQEKYSTVFDAWFDYVHVDNAVTDAPSPDECVHIDGDKNGACDVCGSKMKEESLSDYEKILEKGYFICGVTEFPPFNWTDENGVLTGFDTDFAKAVAKVLGIDVKFQNIDWYQKYAILNSGDIDCIWNGFEMNFEENDEISREELVDFTVPYYEYRLTVVIPADKLDEYKTVEDFVGKTVACEGGSAGVAFAEQLVCDFDKILMMDSEATALIEVLTGVADFAVVNSAFAESECGNGDYASLAVLEEYTRVTEIYAIGCRKDSDFDDKINAAIDVLVTNGTLFEIARKYGVEGNLNFGNPDAPVIPDDKPNDNPSDGTGDDNPAVDDKPEHEHIPSAAVEESRTEPTCKEEGSFDTVIYCDGCGDEIARNTHIIPTLPHTPGDAVEENRVEPGCEPGSYEMVVRCGVCGEEMSRLPHTLEAVHNFEGKKCVDCGAVKASEGLTYVWNAAGDAYEVMKGTCTDTEVGIPAYYNGTPVVAVRDNAFKGDTTITSLVVAEGVESIGKYAFSECTALVNIDIPESVKDIGTEAFYSTSVTRVSLPGVVTIGTVAFKECESLTEVILGDNLETIGSSAFACCSSLEEIHIPEGVTTVGSYAFQKCTALTGINLPDSVATLDGVTFGGCTNLKSVSIGTGLTVIGVMEFVDCPSLESIEVAADNASFKALDGVLYSKDGKTLYCYPSAKADEFFSIPNTVTSVYTYAFYGATNLISLELPQSLTKVNNDAFKNCYRLFEIINKSYMRLTAGKVDDGYIAYYAREVHGASATKIVNSDGHLFQTVNSKNYYIGYIGEESVISMPETYNGSTYEISPYAFYGNKVITEVTISTKTATIPKYAFTGCTSLTKVTLSSKLRSISEYAFDGCTALSEVYFDSEFIGYWRVNGKYINGLSDPTVAAEALSVTYAKKAWTCG